jgi:hypothetical protein
MPSPLSHTDQQSAVRLLAAICAATEPIEGSQFGGDVVGIRPALRERRSWSAR